MICKGFFDLVVKKFLNGRVWIRGYRSLQVILEGYMRTCKIVKKSEFLAWKMILKLAWFMILDIHISVILHMITS